MINFTDISKHYPMGTEYVTTWQDKQPVELDKNKNPIVKYPAWVPIDFNFKTGKRSFCSFSLNCFKKGYYDQFC